MCGRFVDPNLRGTEIDFSESKIDPIPRRFNVKPTQDILTLSAPTEGAYARWGLVPSWFGGALKEWKAATFNARIEDAARKPSFRGAWRHGRCLIPTGGFYEWTGDKGAKQPHFICPAGNEGVLWFAGLLSPWRDMLTCTIVTRAATADMADLHDRMPVILNADEREAWLGGSDDPGIGAGTRLAHHPVARFGRDDDGAALIEPI